MQIAELKIGGLKDAFKSIAAILEDEERIQIHLGDEPYLGFKKDVVLGQSFFQECFLKVNECEYVVNTKELKEVLAAFRTKSQVVSITEEDNILTLTSKTKTMQLPFIEKAERKSKPAKSQDIGTIEPSDFKCMLKPGHPSKSYQLKDGGLNGDLALMNKDGELQMSFYSYSNEMLLNYAFDKKNEHRDFACYILRENLDVLKKLTSNTINELELSVAGKFLKVKADNLLIFLPAVKMVKPICVPKFKIDDWDCIDVEKSEKENLKVSKGEINSADAYNGMFRELSAGYRDSLMKYISWLLANSEDIRIKKQKNVYVAVFKRLNGRFTLIA